MKYIYAYILFWITLCPLVAQSPNPFHFGALVKNDAGVLLANQPVTLRFEIFKTNIEDYGGTKVYAENHAVTTSSKGMVDLQIGTGVAESGSFSSIDWGADSFFLKVSIDRGTGYVVLAEQQFLSVPYAQFAETTGSILKSTSDGQFWGLAVDNSGEISTVPFPSGYTKLVWSDEFNGTGLPDSTKWDYEHGYVRSSELQYYSKKRLENAYQQDGLLHLVSRCDSSIIDGAMRPISSASIITKGKAAWLYGYVEVRAKVPYLQGIGTWPAIWMMPRDDFYGYWPRSGEIDIMEYVASDYRNVHFSQHSYKYNNIDGANLHKTKSVYCPTAYTEFHTYGLQWTPETMIWYLDGVAKFQVNNVDHLWNSWPFNKPFYLLLNLAMGGWGGSTNYGLLKANPQDYQIDYVRVFQ